MFFDTDKPYNGTRPEDLVGERAGTSNLARLMVWLCLVGFWIAVAWVVVL